MNTNETLSVAISGQLTISRAELERLLRATEIPHPPATAIVAQWPKDAGGLPRMAFSIRETAEILGISYQTVYRLLKRGLLRSSSALRCKIIAKTEIERFLKETSTSEY